MEKKFLQTFKNLSVLIAEDNISQREKLREIISLFTDKVILCSDGIEAYEAYEKYKPHMIITDIKMPRMDGLELVKKLRKLDKKIPIIVLTAHTEKHLLLKAVSLHLNNYVVKPIMEDELINSLKDVISYIITNGLLEISLQEGYVYNIVEKCIYKDDEKIKLSKKEVLFLNLLLKYKNQVVLKEDIENILWEDSVMTPSALKNFVFKLRKKIGASSLSTSSTNGFILQTL